MEQAISDSEAPRRFNTTVITAFAIAAVLLAVLGIYSVIAFSVASRVQEMAIRMALGSQRLGIMRLVLTSGAKLACVGCAIGVLGAMAASSLMSSFLFDVSPSDPLGADAGGGRRASSSRSPLLAASPPGAPPPSIRCEALRAE